MNPRLFETRVTEVIPRTGSVVSLRCALPEGIDFQAGQFMQLTLPVGEKEESRYLSFSNAPTEKGYLECTKKLTGSEFSEAYRAVRAGDSVRIKMPMGYFLWNESVKKHALLSGGIGITPIRSILKYRGDRGLPLDAALFYGNRSPEDIIFRSDLEAMVAGRKDLKVVLSLDTPGACPVDWKGKCGFITGGMIKEELPDYAERFFYVCGPPVMVTAMIKILREELGIPDARIRRENFSGY